MNIFHIKFPSNNKHTWDNGSDMFRVILFSFLSGKRRCEARVFILLKSSFPLSFLFRIQKLLLKTFIASIFMRVFRNKRKRFRRYVEDILTTSPGGFAISSNFFEVSWIEAISLFHGRASQPFLEEESCVHASSFPHHQSTPALILSCQADSESIFLTHSTKTFEIKSNFLFSLKK